MKKNIYFIPKKMAIVCVKRIIQLGSVAALLIIGLLVVAPPVLAVPVPDETATYYITSDHSTDKVLGTAPYGTVTLEQFGLGPTATVDVTVTLDPTKYVFAKTGSVSFQDFIFNGSGVVLGDITVGTGKGQDSSLNPVSLTLTAGDSGYNVNPYGTWTFGISSNQGNGTSFNQLFGLSFSVANATIADLTHPNTYGQIFFVDIGRVVVGASFPTGAADVTNTKVPEPASMILLGLGLVGVAGVRRMLKR
jgi:hypothetical protein